MNRFEQVSSDGHQMSQAGWGWGQSPGAVRLGSHVSRGVRAIGGVLRFHVLGVQGWGASRLTITHDALDLTVQSSLMDRR